LTLPKLSLQQTLGDLPPEWPESPLPAIRSINDTRREKLVVLDDDPTGTQTVHDVPVLASWDTGTLASELSNSLPAFYVLSNTRAMHEAEACDVTAEIGRNLAEAWRRTGKRVTVVSRGDSTLRGHFPAETDAIAAATGQDSAPRVLIPFFLEGGRYTIGNVHYVADSDVLTPAGQTDFARDATFGYESSNLAVWVQEKTGGRVPAGEVVAITHNDIRRSGPDMVAAIAGGLAPGAVCVVNAASMRDLEVVTLGLLKAKGAGGRFISRTAASFVRARLGQEGRALLTKSELGIAGGGGALVIVGSHVPKTTAQLNHLLANSATKAVEVDVPALLTGAKS